MGANKWGSSSSSSSAAYPRFNSAFTPGQKSNTQLPLFAGTPVQANLRDGDRVSTDIDDFEAEGNATYQTVNVVDLEDNDVERIEGLNRFPALRRLNLKNNNVVRLQGIGENPSVTDVDVSDNDIVDIGPLSTATNLQRLNVANNNAKGPFTLQASNLIWVNAANNDFTSVTLAYPSLVFADFSENSLSNVSGLRNSPNLETLNLNSNDLSNTAQILDIVRNAPRLREINLADNDFETSDINRIRSSKPGLVVTGP